MNRGLALLAEGGQANGLRVALRPATFGRVPRRRAPGSAMRVAVTSGKGGVGKTTVAANLAALWARRGRKVLVVDGDLGLACMDLALGVKPRLDLADVIEGTATIEETLVEGPFGATLLPASIGRFDLATLGAVARASLVRAIEAVASRFEVVVLDTGAGIGATTIDLAALADEVLLVVTPDPAALRDAYAMVKVLSERLSMPLVRVLANQLDHGIDGERVHERLAQLVHRFLDVRLSYVGGLDRDVAVAEGTVHGVPLVLAEPRSQPARVLGSLVSTLDSEVVSTPC